MTALQTTNLDVITFEVDGAVLTYNEDTIKKGAEVMIANSQETVIDSQDAMEHGATIAKGLKTLAKKVEGMRDFKVRPLNEKVDAINLKLKKGITDPLLKEAKSMEDKMLAYTQEQKRLAFVEQQERQKKAEEERQAAIIMAEDAGEPVSVVPQAPQVLATAVPLLTRSHTGAVAGVKKTWTYELLDIVKLATARPDLVMVDNTKVNAEIRGAGGTIEGLRVYQNESMQVR